MRGVGQNLQEEWTPRQTDSSRTGTRAAGLQPAVRLLGRSRGQEAKDAELGCVPSSRELPFSNFACVQAVAPGGAASPVSVSPLPFALRCSPLSLLGKGETRSWRREGCSAWQTPPDHAPRVLAVTSAPAPSSDTREVWSWPSVLPGVVVSPFQASVFSDEVNNQWSTPVLTVQAETATVGLRLRIASGAIFRLQPHPVPPPTPRPGPSGTQGARWEQEDQS